MKLPLDREGDDEVARGSMGQENAHEECNEAHLIFFQWDLKVQFPLL